MTNLTSEEYIALFLKRKWLILSIVLATVASAWIACEVIPKRYKSTTLIVVESQRVPENYVKGVLSGGLQERLGTIRQLMLSRKLLTDVIKKIGLDKGLSPDNQIENLVDTFRKNIEITTTRDEAFSVSFYHSDPHTTMRVTTELADLFIAENLNQREQLVEQASEFILSELNSARVDLEAKEKALSEFKLRYMGELPGQMEANLRALDRLQADMTSRSEVLHKLTERLDIVEKAIKDYEATGSTTSIPMMSSKQTQRQRRSLHLRELQQRLETLLATYKETYPDIRNLKEEIARMESLPPEPEEAGTSSTAVQSGQAKGNPPPDTHLRELLRQQREVKNDIDITREAQARLVSQIKLYESRVENTPTREQQLITLMRDYDNMQRNYQVLLEKRLNARVAENLERKQHGEQFRIIDPANLPETPVWPDRTRFLLAGLALGCGLGFGSVVVLEQFRVGFKNSDEVERFLGIPVLGTIPDFQMINKSLLGLQEKRARLLPRSVGGEEATTSGVPTVASRNVWHPLTSWSEKENGKKNADKKSRIKAEDELNFITKWQPLSVISEQYRVAATRLALMSAGTKSTVILVTSTVKGEGKSTSSLNLGHVLAHDLGKSTLIIDCDLKNPRVHSYAGIQAEPGLANIFLHDVGGEACIRKIGQAPLWILPAGREMQRPVQLHHIEKLRAMLVSLRDQYEYIILDAPPVFPMADINILSNMADILTIVVRVSSTRKEFVRKGLKALATGPKRAALLTGLAASDTPSYLAEAYYVPSEKKVHY